MYLVSVVRDFQPNRAMISCAPTRGSVLSLVCSGPTIALVGFVMDRTIDPDNAHLQAILVFSYMLVPKTLKRAYSMAGVLDDSGAKVLTFLLLFQPETKPRFHQMAHDRSALIAELTRRAEAVGRLLPLEERSTEDLAVSLLLQERFAFVKKEFKLTITDVAVAADVERSHFTAQMYARTTASMTKSKAELVEPWLGLQEGSIIEFRDGGEWVEDLSALDTPGQEQIMAAQLDRIIMAQAELTQRFELEMSEIRALMRLVIKGQES